MNNDFTSSMNRPLMRVQAYTWRLACQVNPNSHPSTIRFLPGQRSDEVNAWRKAVAARLRVARREGRIKLPTYSEHLGEYV